jgi:hypothetical protein
MANPKTASEKFNQGKRFTDVPSVIIRQILEDILVAHAYKDSELTQRKLDGALRKLDEMNIKL